MKKLIIAAAIVCVAAISNAAAMNWQLSAIQATPGSTGVDPLANAAAYWMDASTYDAFTALSADKVAAFCTGNATYTGTIGVKRGAASVNVISGEYTAGDHVSGYIVVFDTADSANAGYYANTALFSGDVPGAGNLSFSTTFETGTAGWQSIPEPTSGLLLLLGVAGLALRRRRA